MDEFWVCAHCRSLNRAGTGKCYSCREKYGSKPKDDDAARAANAAKAAAPSTPPAGLMPDFSGSAAPSPHYSRPVALAPVSRPNAAAIAAARGPHFPNPVSFVRRRVADSLAMRPSVSVGWLGYVTTALIVLVLAIAAMIMLTVMPAAANLLQHGDTSAAWAQLTGRQHELLRTLSIAFVACGALTLLCFSVFLGLTTYNATGLGAEQPLLTPYQAGMCWTGVLWAQARIAAGLLVPAALLWRGYEIPGLIAAIVAVEIAHHHLDAGLSWLVRPYRHVPDLYAKLGMEGSISSPLAWIWSGCFRVANAMLIVVCAIPLLAFVLFVAAAIAGRDQILGWQSAGLGAGQIVVALLVVSLVGWTTVSVALLAPITFGFVRRQRTRRTLVRVGRARSWVARPGGPAATTPQFDAGQSGPYDEDRIVERVPTFAPEPSGNRNESAPAAGNSMFGGPGFGGQSIGRPGFGAPITGKPSGPPIGGPDFDEPLIGGPGFGAPSGPSSPGLGGPSSPGLGGPGFGGPSQGGPGQASLYSPSTTSSFPWSGDPPVEPD